MTDGLQSRMVVLSSDAPAVGARGGGSAPRMAITPTIGVHPATVFWCLACLWTALIIYGSLMPFTFDLDRVGHVAGVGDLGRCLAKMHASIRWDRGPAWTKSSLGINTRLSDFALNLLLYMPAGVMFCLAAQYRRRPAEAIESDDSDKAARRDVSGCGRGAKLLAGLAMPLTVAVGLAALSYALECAQSLLAWRCGSWMDFATNTTGAALGAFAALPAARGVSQLAGALRLALARQAAWSHMRRKLGWWMLVAAAAIVGMVLADITIGSASTAPAKAAARSISHKSTANWMPFAPQQRRSADVAVVQLGRWFLLYSLIAAAATVAWAMRRQLTRRRGAFLAGGLLVLAMVRQMLAGIAGHARFDVTEPLVAVLVALVIAAGVRLVLHAARVRNNKHAAS